MNKFQSPELEKLQLNFKKLEKAKVMIPNIDTICLDTVKYPPILDTMNDEMGKSLEAVWDAREEREEMERQRHDELIAAIKEAGQKGANIVIGDNASKIQIQQNSSGAIQQLNAPNQMDYEQVLKVLNEIKDYFDYPKFQETFGDTADDVKIVVEDAIKAAQEEDKGSVSKLLARLKDLASGVTSSLIATGIVELLSNLPIG